MAVALREWLQLSLADGLGPILIDRLIAATGSAIAACAASAADLSGVEGIGRSSGAKIHRSLQEAAAAADSEINRCRDAGVMMLCKEDGEYPSPLRVIPSSPPVLWIKGTLEARDLHSVAIVGSRRCSLYGREQADRFGALLAGAGLTVISGGARGIDSAAHRGALAQPEGRTLAVLGCGVDVVYPPENAALFGQIARRGAIISEFPMESPPLKEHFPRRNRIVSGMSRAVLVVEADIRSGALITARVAGEEHGRPVLAIPGRIDQSTSAGTHQLIRDGAVLITRLEDILDELGPLPQSAIDIGAAAQPAGLFADTVAAGSADVRPEAAPVAERSVYTPRQQLILKAMEGETSTIDMLVDRTMLAPETILQELTLLTLRGAVQRSSGQTFALRKGKAERA